MNPRKSLHFRPVPCFYPKPKHGGGVLIRKVVAFLRARNVDLPLTSHILCATSGGADSTALAHLLCRYGRRIVPRDRIRLVHVNHGWRGPESDQDQAFVEELAQNLQVPCESVRVDPPDAMKVRGSSWEAVAREQRKAVFERLSHQDGALVFTAHQADDLAETVLWRILTGSAATHGGGIFMRFRNEIRPLLTVRKSELQDYLREEGQSWREDRTNGEGRFLRSRIRMEIMPALQDVFPRAVDHLAALGLKTQDTGAFSGVLKEESEGERLACWLGALGVRPRRPHWDLLRERMKRNENWEGEVDLPGGWKLIREVMPDGVPDGIENQIAWSPAKKQKERWILEKS